MTRSRGLRVPKGTRPKWVAENQGKHFCRCGCGALIVVKPEHHPNVPQFLLGHNARVSPPRQAVVRPVLMCKCGCGEFAAAGRQYISGHNGRGQPRSAETRRKMSEAARGARNHRHGKFGPESASWKGGLQRSAGGYLLEYASEHPFARKRYVMQHRLVAEARMRSVEPESPFLLKVDGVLYLRPDAEVHHINGIKDDNRPENLAVMSKAEHTRHHHLARKVA